ncbi:MAG: hypothetical protein GY809_01375, partial [Planctomycetes bacterium]|nr:hypothetical protein [Planctomycetota bacterium]
MGQSDSPQRPARPEGVVWALVVYILFAAYLSWPHWSDWTWSERTVPVCWCVGAVGVFLLSRRWIRVWIAALFSGGLYSFGPLALYTAQFHEAGACIVAVLPWLLCPWAYSFLLVRPQKTWLRRGVEFGLFALPFAFVAVLFRTLAQYHLFVMPVHVGQLSRQECLGVVVPLVMVRHGDLFWGLYHVALGAVVLGLLRVVRARCWGLALPVIGAFAVAIWKPWPAVFEVCPLVWWLLPQILMCLCVGLGIVLLLRGGRADRAWVLGCGVGLTGLAVLVLLQSAHYFDLFLWFGAPYARLFVTSGRLYLLGAVGFGVIYVLMNYNRRFLWLRAILVCIVLGG